MKKKIEVDWGRAEIARIYIYQSLVPILVSRALTSSLQPCCCGEPAGEVVLLLQIYIPSGCNLEKRKENPGKLELQARQLLAPNP